MPFFAPPKKAAGSSHFGTQKQQAEAAAFTQTTSATAHFGPAKQTAAPSNDLGSGPSQATPSFAPPPKKSDAPSFAPPPKQEAEKATVPAPAKAEGAYTGADQLIATTYSNRLEPTQIELGQVRYDGHHQAAADSDISGYHFITVFAGREYIIEAHRLEDDLDTYMWVFEGTHTYEDFVSYGKLANSNTHFTTGMDQYLGHNDDAIPYPDGPHGDSRVQLTAPDSGQLTVVVTAHTASGSDHGGDGYWDYRLEVIPVEPLLLGIAEPAVGEAFFG